MTKAFPRHDLTLYFDQRTGTALMIASNEDEAIYFSYSPDTGEYKYAMHGSPLKGLPIKYFAVATPHVKRDAQMIERDLQIIKMSRAKAA